MKVLPRTETHTVIPAWAQRGLQQDLVQTPLQRAWSAILKGLALSSQQETELEQGKDWKPETIIKAQLSLSNPVAPKGMD